MADPVMVWSWDDAPEEYRLRIAQMPRGLAPHEGWLAMAFVPETTLSQLLDEPTFLKPLWRASRGIARARTTDGVIIAWT